MRKIFTIAAIAANLIGGNAPAFAEGDYVAGASASPAWTQADSRTPLVAMGTPYFAPGHLLVGGDDQYVMGPTASPAWTQPDGRAPLAGRSMTSANFDLGTQGN
ncbi:MAG TPA: hypothetical protein VIL69_09815 [Roseomonas sp.]|jgi:transcription elongation factor